MEKKTRVVIGATAVGIAIAGGVYGGWAILNTIMNADALTKFLVGSASAGAGGYAALVAAKREN